jgi:hypothetical protein
MSGTTGILDAADEVLSVLAEHRIEGVVIGAVAMAAHHYVRHTEIWTSVSWRLSNRCGRWWRT